MPARKISRRNAIQLGLPAAGVLYAGGLTQLLSCKNKSTTKDETLTDNKQRRPKKTPVQRGNPYAGRDEMFLHKKTNTLHYPFVFKTYDKIKDEHITTVNPNDWENTLNTGAHFTKEKSALIFERLALREISDINNDALGRSAAVLARSFKTDYAKHNMHNWRGYHLLLHLIALNSALPDKWSAFSDAVKEVNVSQIKKIPKRHSWIASQSLFDQRVQYIQQHTDVYSGRIKKRTA